MRHAAWVIPPLVLAAVLGLGASTKWGRGESLRSVVANLELPAWVLPGPLARAVPVVELALVAGLLTPWPPVFALSAGGALVLMAVYWGLIARGLTLSPRPSCDCFGEVGNHEVTELTLLRNTLLVAAAVASTALAASGRTVWSLLGEADRGDGLWLALGTLACVVTALVLGGSAATRATRTPAQGPLGPDVAASTGDVDDADGDDYARVPTPSAVLHRPEHGPVTLLELSRHRAQLLVFVNCYCASTKAAMADLESWNSRLDRVSVRIVFSVPIAEKFVGTPPAGTLLDHAGVLWTALGLTRSPSAVLLGVDGYLAGGPVGGSDEVRAFIDDVEDALREVPEPGAVAPTPDDPDLTPAEPDPVTSDR